MNIIYNQTTGKLTNDEGVILAEGWAGNGFGKNNPAMQDVKSVGPLPCGVYSLGEWEPMHPGLGPLVVHLTQCSGESFGRDGFYIHGPSSKNYGEESKGCIIIPRPMRNYLYSLRPETITVISGEWPDDLG